MKGAFFCSLQLFIYLFGNRIAKVANLHIMSGKKSWMSHHGDVVAKIPFKITVHRIQFQSCNVANAHLLLIFFQIQQIIPHFITKNLIASEHDTRCSDDRKYIFLKGENHYDCTESGQHTEEKEKSFCRFHLRPYHFTVRFCQMLISSCFHNN